MKKRTLNKIIAFTLCCLVISANVANAKGIKETKKYIYSINDCIDPHPEDPDNAR